jgi:hypothetical protein
MTVGAITDIHIFIFIFMHIIARISIAISGITRDKSSATCNRTTARPNRNVRKIVWCHSM